MKKPNVGLEKLCAKGVKNSKPYKEYMEACKYADDMYEERLKDPSLKDAHIKAVSHKLKKKEALDFFVTNGYPKEETNVRKFS